MVPIPFGLVLGLLPPGNGKGPREVIVGLVGWLAGLGWVAKLHVTASDTNTLQKSTRLQLSST